MKKWPEVALADVCTPVERSERPIVGQKYRQIGVRLWGEGAYEREILDGADTKYPFLNRVKSNDLVVNKIWARSGSVTVVPNHLTDCYVSGEFPLFELDQDRILPGWAKLLTKWKGFWLVCDEKSQGTSGKNRIKPQQFLSVTIPLPNSITDQQTIVARLDAVTEKTRQVAARLDAIEADLNSICRSLVFKLPRDTPATIMGELLFLREPDVQVEKLVTYQFAGVFSFGRGIFKGVKKQGNEFSYERLSTLHAADFTYPKLMAWEGGLGVVPPECEGLVVSPEFPVFTANRNLVLPEVLDVYFKTPQIWSDLADISSGTNQRRRRLQPLTFLNYKMPLPSMQDQLLLRDIFHRAKLTKARHAMIRKDLDALLPSMLERIFG